MSLDFLSGQPIVNCMNKPFDPTKPVQTRDGRPARILATDLKSSHGAIVAIVNTEGEERAIHFHASGHYFTETESAIDLVNVPEKRTIEFWLNVYPDILAHRHDSKKAADLCASKHRIACIHIKQDFVEGEGL